MQRADFQEQQGLVLFKATELYFQDTISSLIETWCCNLVWREVRLVF